MNNGEIPDSLKETIVQNIIRNSTATIDLNEEGVYVPAGCATEKAMLGFL